MPDLFPGLPSTSSSVHDKVINATSVTKVTLPRLYCKPLRKYFKVDVYLPKGYYQNEGFHYPLLITNDGQDMEVVNIQFILNKAQEERSAVPLIFVAIHADKDRRNIYAVRSGPDFKGRGTMAAAYQAFVMESLLPMLRSKFRVSSNRLTTGIMGFSMGALSATDLGWHEADTFGIIGAFSGSFWWRAKGYDEGFTDLDLILQRDIRNTPRGAEPAQRYFIQTGTLDEANDRNKNGIIDSIDDAMFLIATLKDKGIPSERIKYVELVGGKHDLPTWASAIPLFLQWAYPLIQTAKPSH